MRFALVAASLFALATTVGAQEPQDSTLRGIQSATVTMLTTDALTDQQRATIRENAAFELRQSGLRVPTDGESNAAIIVTVERIPHMLSSDVRVTLSVYQRVTIVRLGDFATAPTWQAARVTTGVTDVHKEAQRLTMLLVKQMLDKLLIANGL